MSLTDPTIEEIRALAVLVRVCGQYMSGSHTHLDHSCLSAGEGAVHLLGKYGLIVPEGRGGAWTTKARLLEELDDRGLSNIEEIVSKYRGVADGELLPLVPGGRPHRHDVQISFLRLWFPTRPREKRTTRPHTFRKPPPDTLEVEARLDLIYASATIQGDLLRIEEVQAFRNELVEMIAGARRSANLVGYTECLKIAIKAGSEGTFHGEVTLKNPMYKHSTSTEVTFRDDYDLKRAVASFDKVLASVSVSDTHN